ncbi:MAG: class I SAM-dependent methyltransferase [Clostridiales bacterium]|nr:class I SAM-dependent methyltransferase [Clostridiales bacterium]
MEKENIMQTNKMYWDTNADAWFGTTALPNYGVRFVTEDDLHLFGDVSGKKILEICCGSGHSLKYHADRNAAELWGVDISDKQIDNAKAYLKENGYGAKFICSPMEADLEIPTDYFDFVYSIYGIGWTTDLDGTFAKIASYLKKDGVFIFSWHHTLNYCVGWSNTLRQNVAENERLLFSKSYFDESYFAMPVDGSEIILCNRKISTYVNALAKAGFCIEQMVEQTDHETMESLDDESAKTQKAKMLPISVCFKARKL